MDNVLIPPNAPDPRVRNTSNSQAQGIMLVENVSLEESAGLVLAVMKAAIALYDSSVKPPKCVQDLTDPDIQLIDTLRLLIDQNSPDYVARVDCLVQQDLFPILLGLLSSYMYHGPVIGYVVLSLCRVGSVDRYAEKAIEANVPAAILRFIEETCQAGRRGSAPTTVGNAFKRVTSSLHGDRAVSARKALPIHDRESGTGVVLAISSAFKSDDYEVHELIGDAVLLLGNLCFNSLARSALRELNAVDVVTLAMSTLRSYAEIQDRCCYTLANLSVDSNAAMNSIAGAGVVDLVFSAVNRFPTDAQLVESSSCLLTNLCTLGGPMRLELVENGVTGILCIAFKSHLKEAKVVGVLFRLLNGLLSSKRTIPWLLQSPVFTHVSEAILYHSTLLDLTEAGANIFLRLCSTATPRGLLDILDTHFVSSLSVATEYVKGTKHNSKLMLVFLQCLSYSCTSSPELLDSKITRREVIPAVIRMLPDWRRKKKVLKCIIEFISKIAMSTTNAKILVEGGIVKPLVKVMKSPTSTDYDIGRVLSCLSVLANKQTGDALCRDYGIVHEVSLFLRDYARNETRVDSCLRILTRMSFSEMAAVEIATHGIKSIATAIQFHLTSQDNDFIMMCSTLFQNLTSFDTSLPHLVSSLVPTIIVGLIKVKRGGKGITSQNAWQLITSLCKLIGIDNSGCIYQALVDCHLNEVMHSLHAEYQKQFHALLEGAIMELYDLLELESSSSTYQVSEGDTSKPDVTRTNMKPVQLGDFSKVDQGIRLANVARLKSDDVLKYIQTTDGLPTPRTPDSDTVSTIRVSLRKRLSVSSRPTRSSSIASLTSSRGCLVDPDGSNLLHGDDRMSGWSEIKEDFIDEIFGDSVANSTTMASDLSDARILESKWLHILEECDNSYSQLVQVSDLKDLIRSCMVPCSVRPGLWRILSGAEHLRSRYSREYYEELVDIANVYGTPHDAEIRKDVPRTMPKHILFQCQSGLDSLTQLLSAYCLRNPESVGYCQSLNYLAGVLLTQLKDEDAFWVFSSMIENRMGYYCKSMCALQVDQAVLADLLATHNPAVYDHLTQHNITVASFSVSWFMCHYMYAPLPLESVVPLWDHLFMYGDEMLFNMALQIFESCQDGILARHTESDLLTYLLHGLSVDLPPISTLLSNIKAGGLIESIGILREYRKAKFSSQGEHLRPSGLLDIDLGVSFVESELQELWMCFISPSPWEILMSCTIPSLVWFHQAFCSFVFPRALNEWRDHGLLSGLIQRVFECLDRNQSIRIDFTAFVVGAHVFLKGTEREKIAFCFKYCDTLNDGVVDQDEMTSMIRILEESYNGRPGSVDRAKNFCALVFESHRTTEGSALLSLDEFGQYALTHPLICNFFNI